MPLSKIQDIENQVVPNLGPRNLIINGAMKIDQRNSTNSVQLSATEQFLTDRFFNDAGYAQLESKFDSKSRKNKEIEIRTDCIFDVDSNFIMVSMCTS